jgi:hypothetical protein
LLYAIHQGHVKPIDKALWNLTGPDATKDDAKRGLFNPRRNTIVDKATRFSTDANPLGMAFPNSADDAYTAGMAGLGRNNYMMAFGKDKP